jgi:hypothetical protein
LIVRAGVTIALVSVVAAGCGGATDAAVGTSAAAVGTSAPSTTIAPSDRGVPATNTPARALTTGKRVGALDFAVSPASGEVAWPGASDESSLSDDDTPEVGPARTPAEAVSALINLLIDGRYDNAYALLGENDQAALGSAQQLAAQTAPLGWRSFTITSVADTTVTVDIVQTARISDIDGLTAPTATAVFSVAPVGSGFTVDWASRAVIANHPDRSPDNDADARRTALDWATSAIRCTASPLNVDGGLIGVTGLADQLCGASGAPVVDAIGGLDVLDEPQPIIDGYGSDALRWARVAHLSSPVELNLVLAPVGDTWRAVAIARPTLAQTAAKSTLATSNANRSTSP